MQSRTEYRKVFSTTLSPMQPAGQIGRQVYGIATNGALEESHRLWKNGCLIFVPKALTSSGSVNPMNKHILPKYQPPARLLYMNPAIYIVMTLPPLVHIMSSLLEILTLYPLPMPNTMPMPNAMPIQPRPFSKQYQRAPTERNHHVPTPIINPSPIRPVAAAYSPAPSHIS